MLALHEFYIPLASCKLDCWKQVQYVNSNSNFYFLKKPEVPEATLGLTTLVSAWLYSFYPSAPEIIHDSRNEVPQPDKIMPGYNICG